MRALAAMSIIHVAVGLAQPAAVADDLQKRAIAAMNGLRRAETWQQVLSSRQFTRARIQQSLNLNRTMDVEAAPAFIYSPKAAATPTPAVLLIRPHDDPAEVESRRLPAAVAQMGILVLELDVRAHHSRLDRLVDGVLPQGLIQRDIRSAIGYLRSRPDVDPKRLAVLGNGLAATIAAGINSELSAAILLDGAPDFTRIISEFRALDPQQAPDSCTLIPGILHYATTEELLALIVPRPVLLMNSAPRSLDYATNLYRMNGGVERLHYQTQDTWNATARFAAYAWLAKWLQGQSDMKTFREPVELFEPAVVQPKRLEPKPAVSTTPVSQQMLTSLLGEPLLQGSMTYGLNCRADHEVDFRSQPELKIPVSVLRPGPEGCGASCGTLIAVDDRGRSHLANDEIVLEAIRRGWIVWMPDPRGIGELNTDKAEPFIFGVSLLLGENFTWRQAADILRLLRHVAGGGSRYPTGLYARGQAMGLAAGYVAATNVRNDMEWVVVRDAAPSFTQMTSVPLSVLPVNAQSAFGIPDLWKAAKAKVVMVNRPEDFINQDW